MPAAIEIVDRGRGPQLSTSRITVLDVYYYLHRGHDFDFIHQAMPSLSRAEFDRVREYIEQHEAELREMDRRAEEFVRRGVEAQRARGGVFADDPEPRNTEERVARLRERMRRKVEERNGAGDPG